MKLTGYIDDTRYLFTLDDLGHLIAIELDSPYFHRYNEEVYDDDQIATVRDMLIRDGVRDVRLHEGPASISIDNGAHWTTPADAVKEVPWTVIEAAMYVGLAYYIDDAMTDEGFLTRYLELSPDDLIIG